LSSIALLTQTCNRIVGWYIIGLMRRHLAIFYPEVIKKIISGQKTVESRFSKSKIAPFGQVEVGDMVYMKASGKDVQGQFVVKKVISIEGMDQDDWNELKKQYGDETWLPEKDGVKYGTLIFIGRVDQLITSPVTLQKKDHRGWVVLDS
jgi:ASC-1-like (ASCH) protein